MQLITLTLSVPIDTFLRTLLKDLQQQAEVDRLGPLKLEGKEDSVAGALQSDPAEGSQESHGRGAEGQPREQADAPEATLQGDLLLLGFFAAGCPQEGEIARGSDRGEKAMERESREVVRPQEEKRAVERGKSYSLGHKCILSAGEMDLY